MLLISTNLEKQCSLFIIINMFITPSPPLMVPNDFSPLFELKPLVGQGLGNGNLIFFAVIPEELRLV